VLAKEIKDQKNLIIWLTSAELPAGLRARQTARLVQEFQEDFLVKLFSHSCLIPISRLGYKQTFWGGDDEVRFDPKSRLTEVQERAGLKKQTLDVRLAPESGLN
jgi:hypothetical protein